MLDCWSRFKVSEIRMEVFEDVQVYRHYMFYLFFFIKSLQPAIAYTDVKVLMIPLGTIGIKLMTTSPKISIGQRLSLGIDKSIN